MTGSSQPRGKTRPPEGRLLRVDLSARSFRIEELPAEASAFYLGGRGLGAYLLRASGRHRLDPFDPDAPLIFTAGPLTGTRAPTASRGSATALSPLTGTVFDSNSGGTFSEQLRGAGFEAVWVEGASDEPVYLAVEESGARFVPAGDLWGLGNRKAQRALGAREGRGAALLTIGPAGEAASLLANIAQGQRFFGRGGLGALMGRRRLKAITARGDARASVADPEAFAFVLGECAKQLQAQPITGKGLPQFGTAVLMNVINAAGALPVWNYREGEFAGAKELSGEALRDRLLEGRKGCPRCPIACGRRIRLDGELTEGPEFETLWALGAALGISDLEAVARLNVLANDLGVDTVSAGSTIAAARELFEARALPWDPLARGPEGLSEYLRQMAGEPGPGEVLREGSRSLGRRLGRPEVAMASKGLELPAYDPRGCHGQGLAYATSNRGGCHLRAYMVAPEILATPKLVDRFSSAGKGGLTIVLQNLNAAVDSLILCRFTSFALKEDSYARLLRAATGRDIDGQGLLTAGERIYNLERLINVDRGFGRADDSLPSRLLTEGLRGGPGAGRTVPLEPMLDEYYRFRVWAQAGRPTRRKLEQLSLADFAGEQ